jgi:nitronate monooxygenase
VDIETVAETLLRMLFDEEMCAVVEELKPEVVSFHFGLPTPNVVDRLKRHGIKILSSARGCDGIIAQGF